MQEIPIFQWKGTDLQSTEGDISAEDFVFLLENEGTEGQHDDDDQQNSDLFQDGRDSTKFLDLFFFGHVSIASTGL